MSNSLEILERAVERATGEKVATLRGRTLEQNRRVAEQRHGHRLVFRSRFPFIGRGNVLRDRIVTYEQAESVLNAALKSK